MNGLGYMPHFAAPDNFSETIPSSAKNDSMARKLASASAVGPES
jgi:hypothetical protein